MALALNTSNGYQGTRHPRICSRRGWRSGGLGWALHDVAKRFLKGMGLIASAHVRDATIHFDSHTPAYVE